MRPAAPRMSHRVLFAVSVSTLAAAYVVAHGLANPDFVSDFDQVWAGARALLQGQDPYAVVGPGRAFAWKWPLYYPLPALLLVSPLSALPVNAARAVFVGVSSGLLAFGVTQRDWARTPMFISVCFMVAVELGQWSLLLTAALFTPALGWVASAKPNFAVAMAAGASNRRSLVYMASGSALLLAASFAIQPNWPVEWLRLIRDAPHFRPPLLRWGGPLILLACLRWRRPEARLLAALALVPQPPTFYDQIMLFAVTRTSREALLLSVMSVVLFFYVGFLAPLPSYQEWGDVVAGATVALFYLPCVVMVLRRPNESSDSRPRVAPATVSDGARARPDRAE